MSRPTRWQVGGSSERGSLYSRLLELQERYNQLCDIVEFGAIPGGVQIISWSHQGTITTGLDNSMRGRLPVSANPIWVSASLRTGVLELDIEANSVSVLTSNFKLDGVVGRKRTVSNFSNPDASYGFASNTNLRVDVKVATGSPADLCIFLAIINLGHYASS